MVISNVKVRIEVSVPEPYAAARNASVTTL